MHIYAPQVNQFLGTGLDVFAEVPGYALERLRKLENPEMERIPGNRPVTGIQGEMAGASSRSEKTFLRCANSAGP